MWQRPYHVPPGPQAHPLGGTSSGTGGFKRGVRSRNLFLRSRLPRPECVGHVAILTLNSGLWLRCHRARSRIRRHRLDIRLAHLSGGCHRRRGSPLRPQTVFRAGPGHAGVGLPWSHVCGLRRLARARDGEDGTRSSRFSTRGVSEWGPFGARSGFPIGFFTQSGEQGQTRKGPGLPKDAPAHC